MKYLTVLMNWLRYMALTLVFLIHYRLLYTQGHRIITSAMTLQQTNNALFDESFQICTIAFLEIQLRQILEEMKSDYSAIIKVYN